MILGCGPRPDRQENLGGQHPSEARRRVRSGWRKSPWSRRRGRFARGFRTSRPFSPSPIGHEIETRSPTRATSMPSPKHAEADPKRPEDRAQNGTTDGHRDESPWRASTTSSLTSERGFPARSTSREYGRPRPSRVRHPLRESPPKVPCCSQASSAVIGARLRGRSRLAKRLNSC